MALWCQNDVKDNCRNQFCCFELKRVGATNRRLCGVFCVVWKVTRREDYHGHAATCVCILLGGFGEIREKPDWRIFTGIIKSDVYCNPAMK